MKGKQGFQNKEKKTKILKSSFWPEYFTNIGPEYTKRSGIATFRGMFPRKS